MVTSRPRLSRRSVVRCPRAGCSGIGSVECTYTLDREYVKRSRCCDACGYTWSTLELPLHLAKKLLKLDKFIVDTYPWSKLSEEAEIERADKIKAKG